MRRTGGRVDRGGWGADEGTSGRGAKERRTGEQGVDGRTGRRHGEWRWTGGQADRRMRADGVRTGRTSGRAEGLTSRGFKRPRTLFPASFSSTQTTRLTAERVCRALGSALGSQLRLMLFFFLLRTAYLQFRHNTIVKCVPKLFWLSRIVTRNLWRERTIPWFRQY